MTKSKNYPKAVQLHNGEEVIIRRLAPDDESELLRFMKSLPARERVYFRDDVTNPKVINGWCNESRRDKIIPLIATKDDKIVASWSMHMRDHGWTRHLADLRGIIHPKLRRQGLGALMVYELLSLSKRMDVERVVIELVKPQQKLLKHFEGIGFSVVAILSNWIKDTKGKYQDLHILSMQLEPAWKKMEEMILDYGTHGG